MIGEPTRRRQTSTWCLSAVGGLFLSTSIGSFAASDDWLQTAVSHVLVPASNRVMPVAVLRIGGNVQNADAMFREDGRSCRFTYTAGGPKPVAVLDFGKQSTGGYAVFSVTTRSGEPVVRLSYATHPDGTSETGDFTRETSARYLGGSVDLPVLPANVNRHECYTIPRTGRFIAPLIQGQERYVRIQLDSPDSSVDVDSVAIVNKQVYDRTPHDGYFLCSDERINRLWYASTWTLQLASFPNHDAWKTVDGWLLPRKLEHGEDVGLSVAGADWKDVTVETVFELRSNPHHVSSAGVAVRAQDPANGYLINIGLDGGFRLIRRKDGVDGILSGKKLAEPLIDGRRYDLKVSAKGPVLTTSLDGKVIDETHDNTFSTGRVGFHTTKEKWPLFDGIRVTDENRNTLLVDDFSGDLTSWQFARTLSYVADGAKRDRLIWSGDLYFAQRNVYYAWANPTYMRDSLKMLAFNQTPDGYVQSCPYPETSLPPARGDYGPFPSDEFATWLLPVAWEHLLYTDDVETLKGIHPALVKLTNYLGNHLGSDGLFVQRAETSKHACNLDLGDTRKRAYMNILLWGAFTDASRIAGRLGDLDERERTQKMASAMKRAVFENFWNEKNGYFRDALETQEFGFEANALALSMGIVSNEQARRIAPRLKKVAHGKFQSLASRGLFAYGFGQAGLQSIFDHNWLRLLDDDWTGAGTVSECMMPVTNGWGDESHPDTAIADHFSAYLLGVLPVEPGYRRFTVHPLPTREVTWAKGLVPTPHGPIAASWETSATGLQMRITVPKDTVADLILPKGGNLMINSLPGSGKGLTAGSYEVIATDLPAGVWNAPVLPVLASDHGSGISFKASSSHEEGGWGLANLMADPSDTEKKGYSSKASESAESQEWIELDLGRKTPVSKIVLWPRADTAASNGGVAGFPKSFIVEVADETAAFKTVASFTDATAAKEKGFDVNLYTVIGCPSARYIRLTATRLGEPAADEPEFHRLQFSRIGIAKP